MGCHQNVVLVYSYGTRLTLPVYQFAGTRPISRRERTSINVNGTYVYTTVAILYQICGVLSNCWDVLETGWHITA
jgi:hypothetical protein